MKINNIEDKITQIIGHSDNCKAETGYEDDCNCYIKDLSNLLSSAVKEARDKGYEEGARNQALLDASAIQEARGDKGIK